MHNHFLLANNTLFTALHVALPPFVLACACFHACVRACVRACQVPDGDAPGAMLDRPGVMGRLAALNETALVTCTLGEFGYYFHCLQVRVCVCVCVCKSVGA